MEDMNMTEMVDTQVADVATPDTTAKGNLVEAAATTVVIAAAGYGIGKLIESGVKKFKTWLTNRKKAKEAAAEVPAETVEVEIVE